MLRAGEKASPRGCLKPRLVIVFSLSAAARSDAARAAPLLCASVRRSARSTASVARLPALAAGLGRELRVLGEAALLVRYALPALAARDRGELAVLREAALGSRDALPALAAGLGGQAAILREAALFVRHCLAAHAGNLPLPFRVHRGEATMRQPSFRMSHCCTPSDPQAGASPKKKLPLSSCSIRPGPG